MVFSQNDRLMKHPVFLMHDTNAKLIRAQLFFLSVASIFLVAGGIEISHGASILGIQIENLSIQHLYVLLSILLIYQMIHFGWSSVEAFVEWRLRLTALSTAKHGGRGLILEPRDEKDDARQNTVYAFIFNGIKEKIKAAESKLCSEALGKEKSLEEIKSELKKIQNFLDSHEIKESMSRFDKWYIFFSKAQNIRWFTLEFMLPLILGSIALITLLFEILN